MAKILRIEPVTDEVRYIIKFHLESPKVAKHFEATCLMSVRENYFMADLYAKGAILYLDSPDKDATDRIGTLLKRTIESTPVIL